MKNMNHYDIIIIGGGASGLCTAIMSKSKENKVLIIEHNDRVGKKILSTGNGKCNLTNLNCKVNEKKGVDLASFNGFVPNPEGIKPFYSSVDNSFAETVISQFDADDAVAFFKDLGMIPLEKNGYIYPRSEQASSVLDILRFRCEELGVDIVCGYQPIKVCAIKPESIKKTDDRPKKQSTADLSESARFMIDDEYSCENLVIATGGQSASKTGSDGSGYELAKSFGHSIVKPVPALCALKCSDPFFKELAGVRTDAELSLFDCKKGSKDPELLMTVSGNLQFNNYGISGIPVFQMSLLASRLLAEGHELMVKINLLPELTEEELSQTFLKIIKAGHANRFLGILNKKLANVIEKESKKAHPNEKEEDYAYVYTHMIQRFKVHPIETVSFEEAQTTLGGVSTEEINPKTMESKLVKGLYFTGEIVDESGICGGYNLQWAWSTAHAAARALCSR